ncbi:MAG: glutamyl-tRNA reductase [Gammaproteobacteria bacterium]|jgi:glutamyl-tRNA reductase
MSLFTLGINHRSAPVAVRERMVFSGETLEQALRDMLIATGVEEAAILSTCNRTEIYTLLHTAEQEEEILEWLGRVHQFPMADFLPYMYRHLDQEAVRHTLRVASGLDSMVLGEPQILGQLKDAYRSAHHAGTLGRQLGRLFQHAFAAAKQVRTETAIGASPVSVAFAAVNLAKQIFADLREQTALMIGAGETIELAARHLHGQGIGRLIIANRSIERAQVLAEGLEGEGIALTDIAERLPEADIVISSTASPLPVLGKGAVERALKIRKHRPMLMVDIAVPRDIEPEVNELQDVYLYSVDDLESVIESNQRSRQEAAHQAEEIIDIQVEEFMGWLRVQDAVHTIRDYREHAHAVQNEVLEKAQRMLAQHKDPQAALEYLAHTLTNKLLHNPTQALNMAAREGRDELLDAAQVLLGISDGPDDADKP